MENRILLTWDYLVEDAPPTVKDYALRLKKTPQSWKWHPEGNVWVHSRIVFQRIKKYNDTNLCLAAFFHDLGKVDNTKPNDTGGYSAYDHEDVSARLVKYSRDWIKSQHGNPDKVEWLVQNHMRIKFFDEMKPNKQKELICHEWFCDLVLFSQADSRKGVTLEMVLSNGGNPFRFLWNKFKTFIRK